MMRLGEDRPQNRALNEIGSAWSKEGAETSKKRGWMGNGLWRKVISREVYMLSFTIRSRRYLVMFLRRMERSSEHLDESRSHYGKMSGLDPLHATVSLQSDSLFIVASSPVCMN